MSDNDDALRKEIHEASKEIMLMVDKSSEKGVMISVLPIIIAQLIADAANQTETPLEVVAEHMLTFIVENTGEYLKTSTTEAEIH